LHARRFAGERVPGTGDGMYIGLGTLLLLIIILILVF
jgi:hypothetical protein